jgi:hypothetical protein
MLPWRERGAHTRSLPCAEEHVPLVVICSALRRSLVRCTNTVPYLSTVCVCMASNNAAFLCHSLQAVGLISMLGCKNPPDALRDAVRWARMTSGRRVSRWNLAAALHNCMRMCILWRRE